MPPRLRASTGTVRYGIDVAAVAAHASARAEMRNELGIAPHEVVVGTVANLRRTKGYPDLLAAAQRVLADVADVRFVVVGQGPMEQELRMLRDRLHLGARFRFLGYRDDATRVMSAFDVFCLPSHFEGLPISLMEATALGLPIVATEVGGVPEFAIDGAEAVLVPAGCPELLADAITSVVTDPTRRQKMARAALERAKDADAARAVRAMEAVYAEKAGP
jgi:glycosyltransferase involved in cell wall biosynthesis